LGGRGRGEREGGKGRGGRNEGRRGGAWGARGTDVRVRVPASRQGGYNHGSERERSALHWASERGLAGTVAKLLALGADATLTDKVRAIICISIHMY